MMQGLTQQEAKNRLRQDGKNELAEAPKSRTRPDVPRPTFGMSWL